MTPFAATRAARRLGLPALPVALLLIAASAPARALPLEITTASLSDATAGAAYSENVVAANGTTPYAWSLDSGSLPDGITLDAGTGALSGTATLAATSSFIVRVEDALGDTATRALAITVTAGAAAALAFDQPPTGVTAGATITPAVTVRVSDALGNGVAGEPVALSLIGTGTLSGGAAVATDGAGQATFAGLSVDREGTKQLSATAATAGPVLSDPFTVSCPILTLAPPSLPSGTSGTPYGQVISASGGMASYSFAVTSGALPSGLTLDPLTGLLSGTPATAGTFGFTITASDADSCLGNRAYSLFLCPAIAVLPASAPSASIGVAYSRTFTASAGTAPFSFAVTSGALPAGLSLSAGGLLSGTPTASGAFAFTIGVTAANGCTGSRSYSLDVLAIPSAVTNLSADRVVSGNDGDGTTKILIAFTLPPGGAVAEVYRAPFGHYPQYDDAGGAVPATPSYPPNSPWSLTGVTASGQTDEPATRDFYYYVAFVRNAGGGASAVSNKTGGTCNYALGDVSNGIAAGVGNNLVAAEDVSLLGANYGIGAAQIASRGVHYLDVGPTTDLMITSRPFTDKRIDFEDLIVVATNYGVVSAPQLALKAADDAAPRAGPPEQLQIQAPSLVEPGQSVTAVLHMKGAGRIQGLSAALSWDATVVEALETVSGGFIEGQGGVMLSPQPGTVDAALLGVRGTGIEGEGDIARFTFRALRQGEAAIRLGHVIARDAANRPLATDAIEEATQAKTPGRTLLLAPWPNPTRGNATLAFALAEPGNVELALYSVDGRRVRTLVSGRREAGVYRENWMGDDDERRAVAPGVYYARLTAAGLRFATTIVHLR